VLSFGSATEHPHADIPLHACVMNEVLRSALESVLNDIRSTGAPLPRIADEPWDDHPGVSSATLWAEDGSGRGISTRPDLSEADQIVSITDQVQEWVIEERWSEASVAYE